MGIKDCHRHGRNNKYCPRLDTITGVREGKGGGGGSKIATDENIQEDVQCTNLNHYTNFGVVKFCNYHLEFDDHHHFRVVKILLAAGNSIKLDGGWP